MRRIAELRALALATNHIDKALTRYKTTNPTTQAVTVYKRLANAREIAVAVQQKSPNDSGARSTIMGLWDVYVHDESVTHVANTGVNPFSATDPSPDACYVFSTSKVTLELLQHLADQPLSLDFTFGHVTGVWRK